MIGNATTLSKNWSVWQNIVYDAKKRQRFFHADKDKGLSDAIRAATIELDASDNLRKMGSLQCAPRSEVLQNNFSEAYVVLRLQDTDSFWFPKLVDKKGRN